MADASGPRRGGRAGPRRGARGGSAALLVDAWASRDAALRWGPDCGAGGGGVHASLPLRPLRRPLARIDIRNHRKIAVIDGCLAFTGSANIHAPDHELASGVWHQVSAKLEGPAVVQLQMLFVEDWYFATGELLAR